MTGNPTRDPLRDPQGSRSCPCRFLAGLRVGRLIGVKWRAVVHDPTTPPNGQQVPGEVADHVDCGSAWVSKS